MKTLLHPTYFPNILTFATLVQKEIVWEVHDNYQKQTYRNRCSICTDIGLHSLTIPIQHVGGNQGRQKYREVKLDNSYHWQRQHWRTLQTAYRTSPFFEFYEDDLVPLFEKKYTHLMDFNLQCIQKLFEGLQGTMPSEKSDTYEKAASHFKDGRSLVNAKKELHWTQEPYVQVFGDRHGFIGNASLLDLLFNEGTQALAYLKRQQLPF